MGSGEPTSSAPGPPFDEVSDYAARAGIGVRRADSTSGSPPPSASPSSLPTPAEIAAAFPFALRACLDALRCRPAGLVTDIDGTISPIVLDPAAAAVLPGCREALAALAGRLDYLGVLTGRTPEEARRMVGIEGIDYLGTHGMVRWTPGGAVVHPDAAPFATTIASVIDRVRERLTHPGIIVEAKGPTLAIHYRQTVDPAAMRDVVLAELGAVANETKLALFEGRMVVELRPPLPLGKGWSIQDLAEERDLASLLYLGDDRTDIEAFEALQEWREAAPGRCGVALAVASPEMPPALVRAADYVLNDVPAVELLLRQLAAQV